MSLGVSRLTAPRIEAIFSEKHVFSTGSANTDSLLRDNGLHCGEVTELLAPYGEGFIVEVVCQMVAKILADSMSSQGPPTDRCVLLLTKPKEYSIVTLLDCVARALGASSHPFLSFSLEEQAGFLADSLTVVEVGCINDILSVLCSWKASEHRRTVVIVDSMTDLLLEEDMRYPRGCGAAPSFVVYHLSIAFRSFLNHGGYPRAVVACSAFPRSNKSDTADNLRKSIGGSAWHTVPDCSLWFERKGTLIESHFMSTTVQY